MCNSPTTLPWNPARTSVGRVEARSHNLEDVRPRDLLNAVRARPEITALLNVGSRANSTSDPGSDWDFIVLCEGPPPPSHVRLDQVRAIAPNAHINVFDAISWEFGTTDDFAIDALEMCLSYYTEREIAAKIDEISAGRYQRVGFYYPTGFLAALHTARIIYDPAGRAAVLQQRVQRYPEQLRTTILREERTNFGYFVDRMRTALARRDAYHAFEILGLTLNSLLQLLFASHRVYFRAPKKLAAQLACVPTGIDRTWILENVEHIVTASNEHSELTHKLERLCVLGREIFKEAAR